MTDALPTVQAVAGSTNEANEVVFKMPENLQLVNAAMNAYFSDTTGNPWPSVISAVLQTLGPIGAVARLPVEPSEPEVDARWQPIETAPKGYPALGDPSEWFLAYGKRGPKNATIAVIRRCFGHSFGPWECTGDAYYEHDFFSHWMPLPEFPGSIKNPEKYLTLTSHAIDGVARSGETEALNAQVAGLREAMEKISKCDAGFLGDPYPYAQTVDRMLSVARAALSTPSDGGSKPKQECQAGKGDPPMDCDWPNCGCDPKATEVLAAIEESGDFVPRQEFDTLKAAYDSLVEKLPKAWRLNEAGELVQDAPLAPNDHVWIIPKNRKPVIYLVESISVDSSGFRITATGIDWRDAIILEEDDCHTTESCALYSAKGGEKPNAT